MYLAGFLLALGAIWRFVWPALRAMWRLVHGTHQLVEDYQRSGGFAGLSAQVEEVKTLALSSHRELHPNGGSSMRDTVNATASGVRDIGEKADRLEGYATANREGIARLDTRVTDLDEKVDAQGVRITEHRRRNEQTIDRLETYLSGERDDLVTKAQAMEASVHELLQIEAEQHRDD